MKVLSLFSGIGSFEKALSNLGVGFELVGFSEVDKWAIESYTRIHDVSSGLNLGDVKLLDEKTLPEVDMVTFGFPCIDITNNGLGKGIAKGTKSGLLFEAERIINHVKPKYAIAENVRNLISKTHKKDFEKLLDRLDSYGYNNYWRLLNAQEYGVPQKRERVFIVSIRKDVDDGSFRFPVGGVDDIFLEDILLDEANPKYFLDSDQLKGLVTFEQGEWRIAEATKKGYAVAEVGDSINISFPGSKTRRGRVGIKVAQTIETASTLATLLPDSTLRKLTPLEHWRLMGFDDEDYLKAKSRLEQKFYNGRDRSDTQMYKQAGNAIVVNVLEAIFKELLLEGKEHAKFESKGVG